MASTAAAAIASQRGSRASDPFGGGIEMALVALAVTGVGFYRTFFSKPLSLDTAHLLHGMTSTAWLTLVLVQALLIRSRRFKIHRLLGWTSLLLFGALIVTSWQMVALMLSGATHLPFDWAKLFALSDLLTLPLTIILYVAAIVLRRDRYVHSRLLSATVLVIIVPAVARMFNLVFPGADGLVVAMHPTYLFVLAVLAVAIFADWKNERLRWPFPFAFVWLAATYAMLFPAWKSQWFDAIAKTIGGIA
jgi:hypothetical protein